jgi:hypothetical protein
MTTIMAARHILAAHHIPVRRIPLARRIPVRPPGRLLSRMDRRLEQWRIPARYPAQWEAHILARCRARWQVRIPAEYRAPSSAIAAV